MSNNYYPLVCIVFCISLLVIYSAAADESFLAHSDQSHGDLKGIAKTKKEKKFSELCDDYVELSAQLVMKSSQLIADLAHMQEDCVCALQELSTKKFKPTREQLLKKVNRIEDVIKELDNFLDKLQSI